MITRDAVDLDRRFEEALNAPIDLRVRADGGGCS